MGAIKKLVNSGLYNKSWLYRKRIEVAYNTLIQNDNCQIQIDLTSSNFNFANAKSDGSDLIFTSWDGKTVIPHYIVSYNSGTQLATIWVKLYLINKSASFIYLYYGNNSASATSSFDNTFPKFTTNSRTVALWHFDDGTGGTALDSSGNNNTMTLFGSPSWDSVSGGNWGNSNPVVKHSAGSSLVLNGTSQYAKVSMIPPENGTIEFWFSPVIDANTHRIFFVGTGTSLVNFIDLYLAPNGTKITFRAYRNSYLYGPIDSTGITFYSNIWYHFAMTYGEKGFKWLINGVVQGRDKLGINFGKTALNFVLGTYYYDSIPLQYFNGKISECRILDYSLTQTEILDNYWRRKELNLLITQQEKLIKYNNNPIFIASQVWESASVFEPSIIFEDNMFKMWYSGGDYNPYIGYATSTDGITWTKPYTTPILGSGYGGESGIACRSSVFKDNGTYYMYYSNGIGYPGNYLKRATSTDGITWANNIKVLDVGTWDLSLANSHVWIEGSTWYMIYEGKLSTGLWQSGLATSTDGLTWTKSGANPLSSLAVLNGKTASGVHIQKVGSTYYAWYQGCNNTAIPTFIYCAHSTNLTSWTIIDATPILGITQVNFEFDQVADPFLIEVNGKTFFYYEGYNNYRQYTAAIGVAIYEGTIANLIANITVTKTVSLELEQNL
jgi:hypothetical protein